MAEHRQHHPKGQVEMKDLIESHLPFPREFNSTEAFPTMLYLAQIMQSMGQKTQTEFYRRLVDKLNTTDGTGHNMGALYWQLNDIWEGCSWASFGKCKMRYRYDVFVKKKMKMSLLEINGRWKMFANYIKRAFHPVLPSPFKDTNGDVAIELISDRLADFGGQMRVRVLNLSSFVPVFDESVPVRTVCHWKAVVRDLVFNYFFRFPLVLSNVSGSLPNPCQPTRGTWLRTVEYRFTLHRVYDHSRYSGQLFVASIPHQQGSYKGPQH